MECEIRSIKQEIETNIDSIMVDENSMPYTRYDYSILQYAQNPPTFREAVLEDIPKMMTAGTLWLNDLVEQFSKSTME